MNYKPGEETIALSPLPEKSTEKNFLMEQMIFLFLNLFN